MYSLYLHKYYISYYMACVLMFYTLDKIKQPLVDTGSVMYEIVKSSDLLSYRLDILFKVSQRPIAAFSLELQ